MGIYQNCWICEGWREVTFEWNQESPLRAEIDPDQSPLLIHFEHENWKPLTLETHTFFVDKVVKVEEKKHEHAPGSKKTRKTRLKKKKKLKKKGQADEDEGPKFKTIQIEKKAYKLTRMIPPGKIRYIYTQPGRRYSYTPSLAYSCDQETERISARHPLKIVTIIL